MNRQRDFLKQDLQIVCPRDAETLRPAARGRRPHHACTQCHGILLSSTTFGNTFGRHEWDLSALPAGVTRCPFDKTIMRVLGQDGVAIDICPTCRAIWLDHGEYEKLRERARVKRRRLDSVDVDLGGSSGSKRCDADDVDLSLDSVADLIGEIAWSFFDGL